MLEDDCLQDTSKLVTNLLTFWRRRLDMSITLWKHLQLAKSAVLSTGSFHMAEGRTDIAPREKTAESPIFLGKLNPRPKIYGIGNAHIAASVRMFGIEVEMKNFRDDIQVPSNRSQNAWNGVHSTIGMMFYCRSKSSSLP